MPLVFPIIVFLILSELFALFGGAWFWLLVLLAFIYWIFRRENDEDFQDISLVGTSLLLFFLNFYIQTILDFGFLAKQIHILVLLAIFVGLLKFYNKPASSWRVSSFPVILILASSFLGIWFFKAGILEGLFLKELLFFIGVVLIFRSGQRIVFLPFESEENKFPWLSNILAALVLTQLAWVISFLPINFLSLGGVWLLCFYLAWEFFNWFWRRHIHFSRFLAQAAWIIILIIIIMTSASWVII